MMEDMEMVGGEEMAAAVGMVEVVEEGTVGEGVAGDMEVVDEAEVGGRMLGLLILGPHRYGVGRNILLTALMIMMVRRTHFPALAVPNGNGLHSIAVANLGFFGRECCVSFLTSSKQTGCTWTRRALLPFFSFSPGPGLTLAANGGTVYVPRYIEGPGKKSRYPKEKGT